MCPRRNFHVSRASMAKSARLLRNSVVEKLQHSHFDFALGIVAQVSEVRQESDEEVEIARLVRICAGKDIVDVRNRNNCGIGDLLLGRRLLLDADFILLDFVLLLQALLLLLDLLDRLAAGLVDQLLSRRINLVVLTDDFDGRASVVVELLDVLGLLLGLRLEVLLRGVLARRCNGLHAVSDGVGRGGVENRVFLLRPRLFHQHRGGRLHDWLHLANDGFVVDVREQKIHVLEKIIGAVTVALAGVFVLKHLDVSDE